ncbi:vWA domain-containing protein [Candidatus Methylocalor cossyra]|uniref:MxaC protein n=1 Tax=Candidatus Methylocalor cossyra TaxID=3108543 RepID=A0ABM9NEE1_9GAMM
MSFGCLEPAWLWLAPLALLPLWASPWHPLGYPWNDLVPGDGPSRVLDCLLRLVGVAAFAGLVLGLAGLYRREFTVERLGRGSHLVVLLDRSRSMDDDFAGRAPSGGEESKSAAAVRWLERFLASRPHDRIGVAAFSTGPMFVLPWTDDHGAVVAAIRAARLPGLAQTHIAKGLALALSYFDGSIPAGARTLVLVSDGAAALDRQSEALLRRAFVEKRVRLYWIFLRTAGSPGLFEAPGDDDPEARPERALHLFFTSLGIPYRAYQADSPEDLGQAVADIDRQENLPMRYTETYPRRDLRGLCFALAALALALLSLAKWTEIAPCRTR